MRLWLKDSERRPDPVPVATDDRRAILVGLGAWAIALVVFLLLIPKLVDGGTLWLLWTCVVGLVLGLLGIVYTELRRK